MEALSSPSTLRLPLPSVNYLRVEAGAPLPVVEATGPYSAVVIAEDAVSPEWQAAASEWLVRSGCLYMMAWGVNCSTCDDSVDLANIHKFFPAEIPDDKFVISTWHEHEALAEVFWFAKNSAAHPTEKLERTVLVHISSHDQKEELLRAYTDA